MHPACPGANAYTPFVPRKSGPKAGFLLKFVWVPVRVLEIGVGTPNYGKQPRRVHRRLGWPPTEPQSGFVSQKRAKPSGFAEAVFVSNFHTDAVDSEPAPTGPCGRSSLACPVSSNAMTASSAKRKTCDSQPNFDNLPGFFSCTPGLPPFDTGKTIPAASSADWIFWPYVLGLRAHRLPS